MRSALALSILIGCATVAPSVPGQSTPNVPGSFATAKGIALTEIYAGRRTTFYCDCAFTDDKALDPAGCGYEPRNPTTSSGRPNERATRIEWEHVIPASRFGRMRSCWLDRQSFDACRKPDGKFLSGRKCCRKVDLEFKRMEADLMNLRPAVGELNADRSDRPYGEIEGEDRAYGSCDFEVQGGVAEPETADRGETARTYLYFERVWGMTLTEEERERFERWDREDPPDDWERERTTRVAARQGVGNPFVDNHGQEGSCRPRSQCCRVCGASLACGDSCISSSRSCSRDPGCACQGSEVCE